MKPDFFSLKYSVIERGLCTGCGACIGVCPRDCIGKEYEEGELMPVLTGECIPCGLCVTVCPGADVPLPELERFCFGRERADVPEDLGVYKYARAAWSNDEQIRMAGCDGGVTTGLLVYALEAGLIDCALVVDFDPQVPYRPRAKIAINREEIIGAARTKNSVALASELLETAYRKGYRKIAAVGVSCNVHALRKMQYYDSPPHLARSLALVVGLFCGALPYFEGTRHLLYEWCGIENLGDVEHLEYRGGPWPTYGIVQTKDGKRQQLDRHSYMLDFLSPAFKRDRCLMCPDWSADLADLSLGAYWHPSFKLGEEKGRNSLLVRTEVGDELVRRAEEAGAIHTEPIPVEDIVASHGFELKKHGDIFRLEQRRRFGWPVPNFYREFKHDPFHKKLRSAPVTGTSHS